MMVYSFQVKYKMLEELVKHSLLRADTEICPYTMGNHIGLPLHKPAALRAVDFSIRA
jgi:hypothetical protein